MCELFMTEGMGCHDSTQFPLHPSFHGVPLRAQILKNK